MKKIGFGGVALATTLKGEVTLADAVGPDTVSGKSFDPVPHAALDGSSAVGAGNKLVLAVHVIGTGGVDGYEGVGVGVGVGVAVFVLAPQPASSKLNPTRMKIPYGTRQGDGETARIDNLQITDSRRRNPGSGAANNWRHQYVQAFRLWKVLGCLRNTGGTLFMGKNP